jgi:hypothetical protein
MTTLSVPGESERMVRGDVDRVRIASAGLRCEFVSHSLNWRGP